MIPVMWGAPLKALSGYLPPLETQDFVVYNYADTPVGTVTSTGSVTIEATEETSTSTSSVTGVSTYGQKYDLKMPLGLTGYFTLEEGLAAAKAQGKPGGKLVAFGVKKGIRNDYVLVALYVDDKTKLDEAEWLTTPDGKTLKEIGRVNSYIARTRFGVNAQPNYALLDAEGNQLAPVRGYNLSVDGFIAFLNSGLKK